MTIAIICIPITALVVGFFVLKSVQLGLRWNIQAQAKHEPTMSNPVTEIMDNAQSEKYAKETQSIFDEWVNGKKEKA